MASQKPKQNQRNELAAVGVATLVEMPDESLSASQARKYTKPVNEVDSTSQWAKGVIWNKTKRGERQKMCDEAGWKYDTIRDYGLVANTFSGVRRYLGLNFRHYKTALSAPEPDRDKWLEKAAKKKWSAARLREEIKDSKVVEIEANKPDPEPAKKSKPDPKPKQKAKPATPTSKEEPISRAAYNSEAMRRAAEEYIQQEEEKEQERADIQDANEMDVDDAFIVIGIDTMEDKIDPTILELIYKHWAKERHPDITKDDGAAMTQLNQAVEILRKETM